MPLLKSSNATAASIVRIAFAALLIILFVLAISTSATIGYSRSISREATHTATLSLADADRAVHLSPLDPEVHDNRATVLQKLDRPAEAASELEKLVALRPTDFWPWLRLGHARDVLNDHGGALAAYRQSVWLAPYYAQPHWYLGHLLLRENQTAEAFAEFRLAVNSDPSLLNDAIGFAWATFDKDARAIVDAIQPRSPAEYAALARFFVDRGNLDEAMAMYHSSGGFSRQDRKEFLNALVSAKRFTEAYEVWSPGRENGDGIEAVLNGGFENPIPLDDPGFGWQLPKNLDAARITADSSTHRSGGRSLRMDFNGNVDPSARLLSQVVLVKPNTRYQLSFSFSSRDLATVSLPVITVMDANSDTTPLAPAVTMSAGTAEWSDHKMQFATPAGATAIVIAVQREACASPPCAIYGHIWLDCFSLEKL